MLIEEFKEIIGDKAYVTILQMLKDIGPDARTHRISVVIAAILRFTLSNCAAHYDEGTLGYAILALEEEPCLADEQSEEYELLSDFIGELCEEAGMRNQRESSRGESYNIAESSIAEYIAWHNMPWEDY
jgi:hypothetical protein